MIPSMGERQWQPGNDDSEQGRFGAVAVEADLTLHLHGDAPAIEAVASSIRDGGAQVEVVIHVAGGMVELRPSPVHLAVDTGEDTAGEDKAGEGTASAGTASETVVTPAIAKLPPVHRAVISMTSRLNTAEGQFRSVVVSLDAIPGNQVEGISPLYHISALNGPDAMTAIVQISTTLESSQLDSALDTMAFGHEHAVNLEVVQLDGGDTSSRDKAERASVLAPWLDMDPGASVGGKPVSYLLAQADDSDRVAMLSDNWIIGDAG